MSVVLVTGGSGVLGSKVVSLLRDGDHEVRVLSRRPGAGTHQGDLATGDGVAAAVAGVELIVHAASATGRAQGKTDLQQTDNLLRAAGDARHLLYVSIVGIDQIPFGYYKRKLACEKAIVASGRPHTILRATQFHELLEMALRAVSRWPVAPLPLSMKAQPVAAAEAAARVAELIEGEPLGRAPDFGGPEVLTARDALATWRQLYDRPRRVINLPLPGKVGRGFRAGLNCCPDHADGRQTWAEYASSRTVRSDSR